MKKLTAITKEGQKKINGGVLDANGRLYAGPGSSIHYSDGTVVTTDSSGYSWYSWKGSEWQTHPFTNPWRP